ncbi:hypothetical protein LENED_009595 [Lentinula edodes]|uniref:Uncharacterized protein n=1 Tax=Lentinula edodes TaxID=5353 RepID=A0A1Q3EK57_LENED|nr:hypothetical protein LENED_009595 [Lentinula edodes]
MQAVALAIHNRQLRILAELPHSFVKVTALIPEIVKENSQNKKQSFFDEQLLLRTLSVLLIPRPSTPFRFFPKCRREGGYRIRLERPQVLIYVAQDFFNQCLSVTASTITSCL